ncbi:MULTISPECIES: TetR/AcrR family transcriptional regulator [Dietzia]|uniref:TetR/AcrR family transcriptional regulator n=1 Tax=Dietzia maris TaxID=37915 RepID=A0ABT8H3U2_9ACTN|nr:MULTISPECIES: TetR/AcrR family transcriptional regulator [Dietzia]MDJ0422830.1 TetR/AcrR family transcriptional regulator [Dietzia kunjamensis]MDN4507145.1 TetR/AcrR family transcriptional regulator [Dietzia maris]
MARHGWGGRPPADEEEARQRIIDATAALIDRQGVAKTTLSDVAGELGVTRQTVYRHLGNIGEIVSVVAARGAEDFVDRLVSHLEGSRSPAEAVVEGILYCLRTVPDDPRLNLLLQLGDTATFSRAATSPVMLGYGSAMLRRFPVRWADAGVSDADLDGLAEIIMRLLISMLDSSTEIRRPEGEVRALLERWLVPALTPS